ncbi:hypothetical protein [Aureimonas sp. ME7]|nr:hypothetical protein [Aureimonas sp. ME7]
MSRTSEIAVLGALGALSALGYALWQSEGLLLWSGMAFGFCL